MKIFGPRYSRIILIFLVIFIISTINTSASNSNVEFKRNQNKDLLVKITDPDGIKDYLIRCIRTGNLLAQGKLDCENPVTETIVTIPRNKIPITGGIGVHMHDCGNWITVWAFAETTVDKFNPKTFNPAKRIYPPAGPQPKPTQPPPPKPKQVQVIIIIIIAVMGMVIIILIVIIIRRK